MPRAATHAAEIIQMCLRRGFALAGVAPAAPSRWRDHLLHWLGAGRHGTMDYLAADLDLRLDPRGVLQGARSFIVVADQYARRGPGEDAARGRPFGRIARYARGRNYHEVMKRRLHALADELREATPGSDFRTCVDTVPILERELALLAGLGWQAKNTMVIHPRRGSWLLLGAVATNLDLVPAAGPTQPLADACGTCTRCLDACPTRAITPYSVDASRCISYLTIEHRGLIPSEFHEGMGDWVFGCDVCQEVCPHNSPREDGVDPGSPHAAYAPRRSGFDLLDLLAWTAADREAAFQTSAMKRASLAMMKRNALIALGNWARRSPNGADRMAAVDRITSIAADAGEADLVKRTAAQVLGLLGG
jgi:epoxyqueuosine reductase